MRSSAVVILRVRAQYITQMPLAEYDYVIEALASDRVDHSFGIIVLPWRARRGRPVANTHRSNAPGICLAIDMVAITNQILWHFLPSVGLADLPGDPFGSRMRCDADPQYAPSIVSEDQQPVQQPKRDRRNHEQVNRGDPFCMVYKEGPPSLR